MRVRVLVTFDPHPARILRPHGGPPLITPMARKMELLGETRTGRGGGDSLHPRPVADAGL